MKKQMTAQEIAKVCHEANRGYCQSLRDFSQPSWEDAPDWQKESAVAGVNAIIASPDRAPSESHEAWLAHKKADGWTYGPTKDPVAKTHPCFVPYSDLPVEQKAKDWIFTHIVRAMIPMLD
jgi:hypothetical protein